MEKISFLTRVFGGGGSKQNDQSNNRNTFLNESEERLQRAKFTYATPPTTSYAVADPSCGIASTGGDDKRAKRWTPAIENNNRNSASSASLFKPSSMAVQQQQAYHRASQPPGQTNQHRLPQNYKQSPLQYSQQRPYSQQAPKHNHHHSSQFTQQTSSHLGLSSLNDPRRSPAEYTSALHPLPKQLESVSDVNPSLSYASSPASSSSSRMSPIIPFMQQQQQSNNKSVKEMTKLQSLALQNAKQSRASLLGFTWKSLDESIRSGNGLYVVANGRYVYSIGEWLNAHPGGKSILYAVAGTDISLDYFRESGFDADEFVPTKAAAHARKQVPTSRRASTSSMQSLSTALPKACDVSFTVNRIVRFTENDVAKVKKARKTNVHSKQAIEKLSSLLVGEIVQQPATLSSSSRSSISNNSYSGEISGCRPFDKYEYRRYAITEKKLVNGSPTNPVYQIKFVLLYPFDSKSKEPRKFEGGECVEIQCRIGNDYVSRYYTPVSGSPVAFEIMVKTYPTGLMSQSLSKQVPGNGQFKVRGPFGTRLFYGTDDIPEKLIYIVGGSGITPFLQGINTMLLPLMEPLVVITDHQPQASDELTLKRGQFVFPLTHFYDGWAIAWSANREGVIPLPVTIPYVGSKTKIVLINQIQTVNDIIGNTILEGAMLSYPNQVEMHHFVAKGGIPPHLSAPNAPLTMGSNGTNIPGNLYEGRLNERMLEELVGKHCDQDRNMTQKVIVIGPSGFDSMVVDVLMDNLGIDVGDIKIMPYNTPI